MVLALAPLRSAAKRRDCRSSAVTPAISAVLPSWSATLMDRASMTAKPLATAVAAPATRFKSPRTFLAPLSQRLVRAVNDMPRLAIAARAINASQ